MEFNNSVELLSINQIFTLQNRDGIAKVAAVWQ